MAIIGNSGAGKTTLGKMLVGSILPTSGSVRLDLMDLRNWDQRQFGESIGYLPQDVQLFPGTIKANIARMREDASDQSIFDAAMLADVHELISSFAQGYETMVAADGAPLSGGQKQRIALARAFFGNPKTGCPGRAEFQPRLSRRCRADRGAVPCKEEQDHRGHDHTASCTAELCRQDNGSEQRQRDDVRYTRDCHGSALKEKQTGRFGSKHQRCRITAGGARVWPRKRH